MPLIFRCFLVSLLVVITSQANAEGGYLAPMPITQPIATAPVTAAAPVATATITTAAPVATTAAVAPVYPIGGITNTILAYPAQTRSILSYYVGVDPNKIDFDKFGQIIARGNYQEIYDQVAVLSANKDAINAGTYTSFPYYNPPALVPEPTLAAAGAKTAGTISLASQAATIGVLAAGTAGIAAAASGGGGGGSKNNGTDDKVDFFGRIDIPYSSDPSSFMDAEMAAYPLNALQLENANYAWAKGLTGKGVNIGFYDWFSSDLTSDTQLGSRVIYRNLDITDDCADTNNPCNHGLAVMTAAAMARDGANTVGVAYDANLMMESVHASPNARALADNGAQIINFSCENCATLQDLQYITNKGIFVTVASGNDSAAEPALPADFASQFNYSVVIATGVIPDGNGGIDNYVYNECGSQKEYCMTAYTPNGTSFAAPQIAGAAAVLKQGWSFLTAKQIGQILLYTAKDIGDPGVDVVYGHGLLDLKAAVEPVGNITVASSTGVQQNYTPSSINQNQNTAFGNALSASKNSGTAYVVDSFGRDFAVSPTANLNVASKPTLSPESMSLFGSKSPEMKKVQFGSNFSMQYSNSENDQGKKDMLGFAQYNVNPESTVTLGFSTNMARIPDNGNQKFNKNNFITSDLYQNGFMNFSEDNNQVFYQQMEMKTGENIKTKFSTMYSKNSKADYFDVNNPQQQFTSDYATNMLETRFTPSDNTSFNFKNGVTHEFNSLLGTQSNGAFDLANGADTYFSGLDVSYDVLPSVNLFGSYMSGITKTKPSANSSFSNVSDILSDSFSLTATKNTLFGDDSLSMSVGQPLRVRSGSAQGVTELVNHDTGALSFGSFNQGLTPTGRTMMFQTAYDKTLSKRMNMNFAVKYATEPDHDSSKGSEAAALVKLVYKLN